MKRNIIKNGTMGGLAVALILNAANLAGAQPLLQSSGTTSATASKPAPPKPGGLGRGLIERIEDKLNRALTSSEKKEIGDAVKTAEQAIKNADYELVEVLADATGLAEDKVKAAIKGAPSSAAIMANLETQLGRKLSKAERAEVYKATKKRGADKKAAIDTLALTLVSITGVTEDEAHELLKPPPPPKKDDEKPQGEKPSGEKPQGEKPTGDKPTGGKPSGDKPSGEKPEKPQGGKPTGGKPQGDKPCDKPTGDKPTGEKPTDNTDDNTGY